jgi:ADP-ribose pyrophosphatase YjhB (NUDIX family)
VTEPQMWALIGVFATSMAVLTTAVLRTVRAELRVMQVEFARVGDRIDKLERDVQDAMSRLGDR